MIENKLPSNHIRLAAYTHAAFSLGDAVPLASGNVVAISDGEYAANDPISVTIGRPANVIEVASLGIAVGGAVFADSTGVLSSTTSGRFYGVVVENTTDTTRIAHIGA